MVLCFIFVWCFLGEAKTSGGLDGVWKGGSRHCQAVEIWGTIPLCLVGTIWREQIIRIFEGEEHSILDLQQFFLGSLYEWMTVRSGFSVPSLVEFLDLCSFY